ncbi:MAG: DNA repair protein RecN [Candidatus Goldiibacteriota bacterium HGW-Goldbacteria-1]|jgi:DNA repair protein RecN (Recombination protein N)|nr:MAG: DNA repair protein RecN [Candidatus Goldiibacteriota bacterium HGW-Goldbacteria-1]
MLSEIKIQNYALLKEVRVEFHPGLNILTGETGAGKSIIIGALDIALGERGYVENIRTGEDKAVIEAVFDLSKNTVLKNLLNAKLDNAGIEASQDTLVIKRELNRSSKGRIFINNNAASLSLLQDIGVMLIDIHGQHEHQSLLKSEVHIGLLDAYAASAPQVMKVSELYARLIEIESEIKKLNTLESEKQEKLDILNYRITELTNAALVSDEELENLNARREKMAHSESLKTSVNSIIKALSPASADLEGDGAIELLDKAKTHIEEVGEIDKKAAREIMAMVDDALIKAEEAKSFFLEYVDTIEFDRDALAETEERIELIETLMKKYKKDSVSSLMSYAKQLEEEKKKIELNSDTISLREAERKNVLKDLSAKCIALSELRHKKSVELGKKIEEELKGLGISKASFEVRVTEPEAENSRISVDLGGKKVRLSADGINQVEFMISLNAGEEVKPLVKVASGGEVSRIMLSIKNILSGADTIPVLVFDEIDTGISGKVAQATGKKLKEISKNKQLICITHLPQIAAFSDVHYSVTKGTQSGKTHTAINRLSPEEKVTEVAKLLSGETVTGASLNAARDLINEAV